MAQQLSFILRDTQTGQEYPISPGGLRIGRTSENDVVLSDEKVSRSHATLWARDDQLYIRDENSTNGTWVNDERITAPKVLQVGDRVRIGDTVFEVAMGAAPPLAAEVAAPARAALPVVPIAIAGGIVLVILIALMIRAGRGAITPPTATPTWTPTMVPPTPTALLAPTPTEMPTATPIPVPPAVVPTPGMRYAAPPLLDPRDGSRFSGPGLVPPIRLMWSSVGGLAPDEYYQVIIDYTHEGGMWREVGWIKDTQWPVPDYLYGLLTGPRECHWHVQVMHVTAADADGNPTEGTPVSPPSETWMFTWAEGGGGAPPPQPTATPTPKFRPP